LDLDDVWLPTYLVLVEGLATFAKAEAPGDEVWGRIGHHVVERAAECHLDGSQALVLLEDGDARRTWQGLREAGFERLRRENRGYMRATR
jgi:hypothetical protein